LGTWRIAVAGIEIGHRAVFGGSAGRGNFGDRPDRYGVADKLGAALLVEVLLDGRIGDVHCSQPAVHDLAIDKACPGSYAEATSLAHIAKCGHEW